MGLRQWLSFFIIHIHFLFSYSGNTMKSLTNYQTGFYSSSRDRVRGMKHACCAHCVSVCERAEGLLICVGEKNKNKFVTVDISSVKVWGCRITAKEWSFPNRVESATQIFDKLYGREPLQVIKDSPKVRCLYRQQGGITDSCLQWLNVFLLVYGQGQKSMCRKDF